MITPFNKEEYIKRQERAVSKLLATLDKQGITFSAYDRDDDTLQNVMFFKGGKHIKMSRHSFYHFSGMAVRHRHDQKTGEILETIPLSDEQWLFEFIKPIVETLLTV